MNMNNFKFCFYFFLQYALSHNPSLCFWRYFPKDNTRTALMGFYSATYTCYFLFFKTNWLAIPYSKAIPIFSLLTSFFGFTIICIFAICYHTEKQTNKQTIYSFNNIQALDQHIIQYHNFYKTLIIMMRMINFKNYIHRGPCTPCGKMTHKENLEQSQNHF